MASLDVLNKKTGQEPRFLLADCPANSATDNDIDQIELSVYSGNLILQAVFMVRCTSSQPGLVTYSLSPPANTMISCNKFTNKLYSER